MNSKIGKKMKNVTKLMIVVFLLSLFQGAYAEEKKAGGSTGAGVNLKVGQNFYFEGNVVEKEDDQKEASMAEIKKTPFYQTTWFITTVSLVALAGISTGVYFLTANPAPSGNVVSWSNSAK